MRLLLLTVLFLTCFIQAAVSQRTNWGIEYGLGHSSLNYSPESIFLGRESERFLLSATGFTEKNLSKSFSVQLGLRYSLYGNNVRVEYKGNTTFPNFVQKGLHHLAIPTRIRYKPFKTDFYLLAGYQIGYILHIAMNENTPLENSTRYIDEIDRHNLSFTGGFGYRKVVDKRTVMFQALYERGIGSLWRWESKWKAQGISIQSGFVF